VYKQQLAQEVFGNADLRQDAGLFIFGAILASGKSVEVVERAVLAEVEKMKQAPVSDAELQKAKNQIVTEELQGRETNNGKAFALAHAAVLLGNPAEVNNEIDKLLAVSAADVQRVMKEYCSDKNRVVIRYLPESARKSKPAPNKKKGN
jgi:zinc protease